MAEAMRWGKRGARINSISPGIIVTPLALDEFNGPRATSTRICLRNVLPVVPELLMKSQM